MTKCLCCGRQIPETAPAESQESGWHSTCIKKFFGTGRLPDIDVSGEVLERLAAESTSRGFTVPGVQKKLSLHLTTGRNPRLTLVNYPTGYILKPQTDEYGSLPEAEYLVMDMACKTGIKTVPFALVKLGAQGGNYAYITKRIDRVRSPEGLTMLAMEDFCQLDGRLTQDKYRGSYERCAKIVTAYSAQRGLDLSELFLRLVFSFATGNSDMHLKHFSLIETECMSGKYVLSAAYDMLPVNVVLPEDQDQLALTMNGKKRNLRKKDFFIFAETAGLPEKTAKRIITQILSMEEKYLSMVRESYMHYDMKIPLEALIKERIDILR